MELVNIQYAGPGIQSQDLSQKDKNLVTSNYINSAFGQQNDYLELYIYTEGGSLLEVDYDASDYYPFITNNPKNNTYSNILLDPEKDLRNRSYNRGNLTVQYNFYTKLFNSAFGTLYWIKEISTSRTEIKLASQVLSDSVIRDGFNAYQSYISRKNYYPVFYLNFGNNQTVIANNAAYTEDEEGAYLLIKLYEPLPTEFDTKTQLWIVDKVAESVSFNVSIDIEADNVQQANRLRGPNYNVVLNTKNGQTTPYYNYNNLLTSDVSSSYQKLKSYYQDKAIQINVDYSNFSNFVHFSSAVERVNNFVYKLQLIESSNATIAQQQGIVGSATYVNTAITAEQQAINNIIKNFDTYEYFLYFESSSWAWPKSTSVQPYALYSTTSSQAINFLGGVNTLPSPATQSLLWSASYYDSTNKDLLHNSIPQYLLDDPSNAPYITFLDMIGQHFDNIWIYYKDVTNRFNATNNPNTGISLDLVGDALKGLGYNLYTNSNVSDNLYYTLFGINPDGSLLPPTGSEIITNYVTSSLVTLPAETIQDELYKRVYHNLPYLLKSKGTTRGVKALIATYGIPDNILTVREFGGNFTGSLDGIIDLNTSEYKVAIVTGSNGSVTGSEELSGSLLSAYTTIQYYKGSNRLNSTNIEVGFSPADVINANISASQGIFSLDQLIGSPGLQYSASYTPLVSASNAYFTSYTQPNSIWEYIRLIKFYNNTLFKTIKDFVPARANISTGIIIKSHMFERNKYPRHEPIFTFNDYSQSIEILDVSADNGGSLSGSTDWSGFLVTPLGPAYYSSTDGIEKYNGELSGSLIVATDGKAMEQGEYSNTLTGSYGKLVNLGALYQNITSSVRSTELFDLDYNSNQTKPVNYGAVTYSISQSQINSYETYTNPNNPYAQVQDYNYNLKRSISPRYSGSKVSSATYTTYTAGDQSYGKTAAIDKIKYQYGYLVDIYTASKFMPNRSNAQIKYIIDNSQNVLDLTKVNKNIFEVQNIYKSGETSNISLFDYDERNPYVQQLANNPDITIYEGGFRYLPILHNISGSNNTSLRFNLANPVQNTISITSGGGTPDDARLQISNYSVSWWSVEAQTSEPDTSNYSFYVSASYTPGGVSTYPVYLTVYSYFNVDSGLCDLSTPIEVTITIAAGSNTGVSRRYGIAYSIASTGNGNGGSGFGGNHWPTSYTNNCSLTISNIAGGSGGGGSTTTTTYTTYVTTFNVPYSSIYYISQSNEIAFDTTMSYYYAAYTNNQITFDSTSDVAWAASGLDPVILPLNFAVGDKISLYNSASLGWNEISEYTIKNVRYTGSVGNNLSISSSLLLLELYPNINARLFGSGPTIPALTLYSGSTAILSSPFSSSRYVFWKHVPDETNVMLRYNPKDPNLVENGLLFPQYIDTLVRDNSGNVIKALKQQNLI